MGEGKRKKRKREGDKGIKKKRREGELTREKERRWQE